MDNFETKRPRRLWSAGSLQVNLTSSDYIRAISFVKETITTIIITILVEVIMEKQKQKTTTTNNNKQNKGKNSIH